jgi:hypothetical protein
MAFVEDCDKEEEEKSDDEDERENDSLDEWGDREAYTMTLAGKKKKIFDWISGI